MANIKVSTQYYENYSDNPNVDHWKPKGELEFVIKNVDLNTLCNSSVDTAGVIIKLLEPYNNKKTKCIYLGHEIQFEEPWELDSAEFNKRIKEQ